MTYYLEESNWMMKTDIYTGIDKVRRILRRIIYSNEDILYIVYTIYYILILRTLVKRIVAGFILRFMISHSTGIDLIILSAKRLMKWWTFHHLIKIIQLMDKLWNIDIRRNAYIESYLYSLFFFFNIRNFLCSFSKILRA